MKRQGLKVRQRQVLFTGCCRSGTQYVSQVFQRLGYDVQHENVGKFGCSSSLFVVNDEEPDFYNIIPAEWSKRPRHEGGPRSTYSFKVVFHQVRHPLKVIASQAKSYNRAAKAWFDRVGLAPLDAKPNLLHATHVYINMTRLADEMCHYRYRLEDFENEWENILSHLKMRGRPIPDVSKKVNAGHGFTKPIENLTIRDIEKHSPSLAREVVKRAKKYGYEV